MARRGIVLVDVDDTTADLCPTWVEAILQKHPELEDPYKNQKWTEWDLATVIPPDYHLSMWSLLNRELYLSVKPIEGALEGVEQLRQMGFRVVFVTTSTVTHAGAKLMWLQNNLFLPPGQFCPDYVEACDKSLIRGDFIIDDRPSTCRNFQHAHPLNRSILFLRPPALAPDRWYVRDAVSSWAEIPRKILEMRGEL